MRTNLAALVVFVSLPFAAHSQIDPATAAQLVAAAYQQMSAMQESWDEKKWREQVSGKLDTILANTYQILARLEVLEVRRKRQLDDAFATAFAVQISPNRTLLDSVSARVKPADMTKQDITNVTDITNVVVRGGLALKEYGYVSFPVK